MALSYVTYAGDAATTNFSVTFDYIINTHVKVYLDGVLQTVTTHYTWFNATTVQFLAAPGGGVVVRLERETPNTARLVDFQDAGNLTEADLDASANQLFYLVQEATDQFADEALTLATDDKWDAESKVIKNVAEPSSSSDAATKNYADAQWIATLATVAAAVASTAADVVTTNADAVSTAADAVSTAADAASTAADASDTAADLVQTNLDQISCAADAVSTAADAVSTAADAVSTAADVSSCVSNALSASNSAVAAAASESAAAASETAAGLSETAAAASEVAAAASETAAAASATAANRRSRNMIINGCMRVWQREETFTSPATSTMTADRWRWQKSTIATVTVTRQTLTATDQDFKNYLNVAVTAADVVISSSDNAYIQQTVEAPNMEQAMFGNAAAADLVLSFSHSHTKTGTHSITIRNAANTRSYVGEYTQTTTNTWERSEIVIPGDQIGTWATGEGNVGLRLGFCLAVGSTYSAIVGWSSANILGSSSQVNNLDNTANVFRLANVQLEVDYEDNGLASSMEHRDYSQELEMCQRYYEKSYVDGVFAGAVSTDGIEVAFVSGMTSAAKFWATNVRFRVQKSMAPTVTVYSPGTGGAAGYCYDYTATADAAVSTAVKTQTGFKWYAALATAVGINAALQWTAEADLV